MKNNIKIIFYILIIFGIISCSDSSSDRKDSPAQVIMSQPRKMDAKIRDQLAKKSEAKAEAIKYIKQSQVEDLMGTYVGVDVCVVQGQENEYNAAMEDVWRRLLDISWRMSTYTNKGDVYDLNNSLGQPVTVGEDTYKLIEQSIVWSKETIGAFDITVGPLINLWKNKIAKGSFPLAREIKNVRESVGWNKISLLENNQIQLSDKAMIALGGVAKGYAVDEVVRILRERGFSHFLVDAGGDVYVAGHNCEKKPWHIGIKDPLQTDKLYAVVEVSDMAVTTSGDYEQFQQVGGNKISHIINPITGYPQKGVVSATVIAPTAAQADAYSTALMVLGSDQGVGLLDTKGESVAALVLSTEDSRGVIKIKEHTTASFEKFRLNQ